MQKRFKVTTMVFMAIDIILLIFDSAVNITNYADDDDIFLIQFIKYSLAIWEIPVTIIIIYLAFYFYKMGVKFTLILNGN